MAPLEYEACVGETSNGPCWPWRKEHGRFQTRMNRCFIHARGNEKMYTSCLLDFCLYFKHEKRRWNEALFFVCQFQILMSISHTGERGVQWLKKHLHHCQDKVASSTHFSTKQFETRPGDVSSWACSHALATGHCASGVSANGLALAGQLERKGSWGKLSEVLWKSGDQPGDHWLYFYYRLFHLIKSIFLEHRLKVEDTAVKKAVLFVLRPGSESSFSIAETRLAPERAKINLPKST